MESGSFENYLKEMDFVFNKTESRMSSSVYYDISAEDGDGDLYGDSVIIRVSTHALPPAYGRHHGYADFEIGTHQDADGNHADCIHWIADKFKISPPAAFEKRQAASLKRLATIAANQASKKLARQRANACRRLEKLDALVASGGAEISKSNSGLTWYIKGHGDICISASNHGVYNDANVIAAFRQRLIELSQ